MPAPFPRIHLDLKDHDGSLNWTPWAGTAIIIAAMIFAGVMDWTLFSTGIKAEYVPLAFFGVLSLVGTAIVLHLGADRWALSKPHRLAANAIEWLDIAIMGVNALIAWHITSGDTIPLWANMYRYWALPAQPILVIAQWVILFKLDHRGAGRSAAAQARANFEATVANATLLAQDSPEIRAIVAEMAGRQVIQRAASVFEIPVDDAIDIINARNQDAPAQLPAGVIQPTAPAEHPLSLPVIAAQAKDKVAALIKSNGNGNSNGNGHHNPPV